MDVCGREIRTRGSIIRVAFVDGEGYQFLKDPQTALAALRESRPRADIFTFIQPLADPAPKYSYPMEYDNFADLPVSTFEHWWKDQIGFKARNKAKQAEKRGVVVREVPLDDALLQGIHAIYNECPIRQGRRFPHYGKDIETLRGMKSTFLDRSVFIGAFFDESLIGFAKVVSDEEGTQAGLMHILSMVAHRDKAPTNALIAQAVRCCAERQIEHLWYANFNYGKRGGDSLADFKQRNGFRRANVPRYYVPLTSAGTAALRLGLHHQLLDWVPAPAAVSYRWLRKLWYATRYPQWENA